jgi:glycosyltransferase involved in cell wall biosynthesis
VERARSVALPCPLKLVRCGRVFPGIARNEGVAAAAFDWLAFTDGGIVLHPTWLAELLAVADEETDIALGNVDPVCDTFFRQCAAIAYVSPRDRTGNPTPSIASAVIRRDAFARAGGFLPYRAAEDNIFFDRVESLGLAVAHAPRATVYWTIAGTFGGTFARFASYSYHNLLAGWGYHWHLGLARLYAILTLMLAAGIGAGWNPWVLLLLPAFFAGRAARAAWRERRSFPFVTLHPARILFTALLLVVIDMATLAGFLRWVLVRAR